MKNRVKITVLFVSLCAAYNLMGQEKVAADNRRAEMMNAHVRAFSAPNNLLADGIPNGGNDWYTALQSVELYVNNVINKKRNFPKASANQDAFNKALESMKAAQKELQLIRAASDDLINTTKIARNTNFGFDPNKYDKVNLDQVKKMMIQLNLRYAELQNIPKRLAPKTTGWLESKTESEDVATIKADAEEVKRLIKDTAYALELTYKKLQKDWEKIKDAVTKAKEGTPR